jgi:hypothetical protein
MANRPVTSFKSVLLFCAASMSWEHFNARLVPLIQPVQVLHPYPNVRFDAKLTPCGDRSGLWHLRGVCSTLLSDPASRRRPWVHNLMEVK